MNLSRKQLYQIAFVVCLIFIVARFTQAPDFSASLLGFGFFILPWGCFTLAVYISLRVRKILKVQKNIEAKLDLLVQRGRIS